MKIVGLIPVREESIRLPQKALKIIAGLPMFSHVYFRASYSKNLDELFVCTDSDRVISLSDKLGIKTIKTGSHHKNGTERCHEAAQIIGLAQDDIVIDIQGDEALLDPTHIDHVIQFYIDSECDIVVPHLPMSEMDNQNIVKLVLAKNDRIIYMSRADVPYFLKGKDTLKKHLSIIGFSFLTLEQFCTYPVSKLEQIEGVELLRAIENGMTLISTPLSGETRAVDSYQDLEYVRKEMPFDSLYQNYKDKIQLLENA